MEIILKQYRDRCYINSLLCEASYNFYNMINNIMINKYMMSILMICLMLF